MASACRAPVVRTGQPPREVGLGAPSCPTSARQKMTSVVLTLGRNIEANAAGFADLAALHASLSGFEDQDIVVWFLGDFFAADMSGVLGAVLDLASHRNRVALKVENWKVEGALRRNGFMCHFGRPRLPDNYRSSIDYRVFDIRNRHDFRAYVDTHVITRPELPAMSSNVRARILRSIYEIYGNAVDHSESARLFTCGQTFPNLGHLDVTFVDVGIGFRERLRRSKGIDLGGTGAIRWALEEGNTTRTGPRPGGIGLKDLVTFISMNRGRLTLASDSGYIQWDPKAGESVTTLETPFPGSVVSLRFNAHDEGHYYLDGEDVTASRVFV